MSIDDKELEEFMPALELEWTDEAQNRMKNVPFFVRKSVVRGIEQYAKDKSLTLIDDEVVSRARQEREGAAMEAAKQKREAEQAATSDETPTRRQYVSFTFYKLDPAFRRLPKEEREKGMQEFIDVLEEYDNSSDMILLCYSMVGIRGDVDIMTWRIWLRIMRIWYNVFRFVQPFSKNSHLYLSSQLEKESESHEEEESSKVTRVGTEP